MDRITERERRERFHHFADGFFIANVGGKRRRSGGEAYAIADRIFRNRPAEVEEPLQVDTDLMDDVLRELEVIEEELRNGTIS